MLKILRHRKVFRDCHDKLTQLENALDIDALRPDFGELKNASFFVYYSFPLNISSSFQ
jgi:hypothetical protein